ncbi:MAG TPA: deoxyribonuclease V [Thermodesulfovibrionales bacterium]|nr:deoxyribonuclease V [Thermodesulfovibrionales bacterium]
MASDIAEAREIQESLRKKIRIAHLRKTPRFVAGVDAAFTEDMVIGVACLYQYPEMIHLENAHAVAEISFPYVPGFLTFREGPAIITALSRLTKKPDLILVDGQGIAHPKGIGIASHLGVLLKMPTIGCAKSRLIGEYTEPGKNRGEWSPLRYNGKIVGSVLRTRDNTRALFVSPGHKINIEECREIVLNCATGYRIPEPLRRADRISRALKRKFSEMESL